jgi:hypothetical protein
MIELLKINALVRTARVLVFVGGVADYAKGGMPSGRGARG